MPPEPISLHTPALPPTPGFARSWGQRRGEKKKMWASGFAVLGLTPQAILFRPSRAFGTDSKDSPKPIVPDASTFPGRRVDGSNGSPRNSDA